MQGGIMQALHFTGVGVGGIEIDGGYEGVKWITGSKWSNRHISQEAKILRVSQKREIVLPIKYSAKENIWNQER